MNDVILKETHFQGDYIHCVYLYIILLICTKDLMTNLLLVGTDFCWVVYIGDCLNLWVCRIRHSCEVQEGTYIIHQKYSQLHALSVLQWPGARIKLLPQYEHFHLFWFFTPRLCFINGGTKSSAIDSIQVALLVIFPAVILGLLFLSGHLLDYLVCVSDWRG